MREVYGDRLAMPLIEAEFEVARAMVRDEEVRPGVDEMTRLLPQMQGLIGDEHNQISYYTKFLADALSVGGDYERATGNYRRSIAILEKTDGGNDSIGWRTKVWGTRSSLATIPPRRWLPTTKPRG